MPYTLFQIPYVSWKRPHITRQEEAAIGQEIAQFGRQYFRRRFRHDTSQSFYTPERKERIASFHAMPRWRRVVLYTIFVGFFVLVFAVVGRVFIRPAATILVIICLVYFGTFGLALLRYDRWLKRCLYAYYDSVRGADPANRPKV